MTAAKIIGAIAGSFSIAYVCDSLVSDRKIFGGKASIHANASLFKETLIILTTRGLKHCFPFKTGSIPKTITEKGWWEETDKKFQAWPRTAGPPVVMNPISRQNFIVKSSDS